MRKESKKEQELELYLFLFGLYVQNMWVDKNTDKKTVKTTYYCWLLTYLVERAWNQELARLTWRSGCLLQNLPSLSLAK